MERAFWIRLLKRHAACVAAIAFGVAALPATAHTEGQQLPAPNPAPAAKTNGVDATPVATVDAFHTALTSGNTRRALDLLAEDVLIFESGGVERGRAEYASHHLAADAAYSAAVQRAVDSRSHGAAGDTAWVTTVETVTGTYRGRAVNSRSVETMLLRRAAGQWRITHIHWSSKDITLK